MLIYVKQQQMDRKQPLNVLNITLNEREDHNISSPRTCQLKGEGNVMN